MIADVNDVRVRRAGNTGPAVVFAVDPPNALEHYDALFRELDGRRRFAFEIPGFGGSRRARGGFAYGAVLDATIALLDELAAGPYVLAFPCAAGHLARGVAQRRPDLVRALFYQQTPTWPEQRRWAGRIDRRRILRTPLVGQGFMLLRAGRVATGWYSVALGDEARRRWFDDIAQRRLRDGARYPLASMLQAWFRGGDDPAAGAPTAHPAQIVWGLDDRSHRRTDRAGSAALAPGSPVEELPGIGHFYELEDPAGFARRLDALLAVSGG